MNFILDPIKILYFRSYRNLQNVLNNVTSAAGALFAIFGNICRPYNAYKLKVDFIEENRLFKLDKQAMRENKDIILNLQQNEEFIEPKQHVQKEESEFPNEIKLNSPQLFEKDNKTITKSNRRQCKKIKMKSFFDKVFCCKHQDTIRNEIYSNASIEFYKLLVDSKRLILLSTQFEDLKKAWLKIYQNAVFNNTKVIIDRDEMTKMENNIKKFENYFQYLKRKINKKKGDEVDKMIIRKF